MKKVRITAVAILLAFWGVSALAQKCRVVEYAELRDMSTSELISLGNSFLTGLELRQISLDYDLKASSLSNDPIHAVRARQTAQDLEQCISEADRIAAIVRKRKDLKKTLATPSMSADFIERYKLR